jgi:hypothetical protein
MSKISQQTGSQNVTISGGGGQTSLFELPTQVFSLGKSELYFDITPDEDNTDARVNWMPKDCASMIARMQLYTRSGVYLADVPYVQNYTKVVNKPETSLEEFLQYDNAGDVALEAGAHRCLRRSNALASSATKTVASPFAKRSTGVASIHYTEPQYLEPGVMSNSGGAGANPSITVCLPLSHFKNTILACRKDLYFGEVIILRIEWAPVNRIAWHGTSITVPATGSEANDQDVEITNLSLFLAVERNQDIANSLMAKVNTGFSMLMPYVHGYKTNLGAGSQSISLKFNRGHGASLLKVYHAPFNNVETTHLMHDHDNLANAKVSDYYTSLNNTRRQQFNVDCAQYEDWMLHKEDLKGSVVQNRNMYAYNWFVLDKFSGLALQDADCQFNIADGLDLNVEQKIDINATGVVQTNWYSFAVTQRILSIGPAGIEVR